MHNAMRKLQVWKQLLVFCSLLGDVPCILWKCRSKILKTPPKLPDPPRPTQNRLFFILINRVRKLMWFIIQSTLDAKKLWSLTHPVQRVKRNINYTIGMLKATNWYQMLRFGGEGSSGGFWDLGWVCIFILGHFWFFLPLPANNKNIEFTGKWIVKTDSWLNSEQIDTIYKSVGVRKEE